MAVHRHSLGQITIMSTFAKDIDQGLSASNKHTSSKYFYDDKGSQIFQQIMDMPEYYLTNSEYEILETQSQAIFEALAFDGHFNIVELGAGDGLKTNKLLTYLVHQKVDFTYIPVDISEGAMLELQNKLLNKLPELSIQPLVGDYFEVLEEEMGAKNSNSLFLFLGSNIGNYDEKEAVNLLQMFNSYMKPKDKLLIGIDLKKNPHTIKKAYDDDQGITRSFNLNLLERINRELGADFQVEHFDFYSTYNPQNGEVRSYLISLKDQKVYIDVLEKEFDFAANELIATELSKKYSLQEIEDLASASGFQFQNHFLDTKNYFADSLWVK